MPARVVFMGSPAFALDTLRGLAAHYAVVGVVTQPDRRAGRGRSLTPPPVKELAQQLGLPVAQPRRLREPEAVQQLRDWVPDVIVVAAFGQILRPEVLDLPPHGCVNVHASLLPRWRGASPITAAILHGDAETGITIMRMDPGMDTGPMLSQRAIHIAEDDTTASLAAKLAPLGAELLLETLPRYLSGELQPQPQPEDGVTLAPLLTKEDGQLDLAEPAAQLARKIRAYYSWPAASLPWKGGALKVLRAHAAPGKPAPGQRKIHDRLPAIATGDGWLVLDEVQPPGKKPMSGRDFLQGARDWES
jgi:methionyl-tRNA formyltransferase